MKRKNLDEEIWKKFNNLTVIKFRKDKSGRMVLCRCSCGVEKWFFWGNVRRGLSKTCGCRVGIEMNKTHGLSSTRFERIYTGILQRCNNPKRNSYQNYGGRGIKCEWNIFEDFIRDMRESYLRHVDKFGELNTTIERNNNNGNYCKENCRWSTLKEQGANKRNNVILEYKGKKYIMAELTRKLLMPKNHIYKRLRMGYKLEDIIKKYESRIDSKKLLYLRKQILN